MQSIVITNSSLTVSCECVGFVKNSKWLYCGRCVIYDFICFACTRWCVCVCVLSCSFFGFIRSPQPWESLPLSPRLLNCARACQSINCNSNGPWMCVQLRNIIEQADLSVSQLRLSFCVCVYVCELSGFVVAMLSKHPEKSVWSDECV